MAALWKALWNYVFIPENTQSELYVSIGILSVWRPYGKPYGITSLFPENTQCKLYVSILRHTIRMATLWKTLWNYVFIPREYAV